MFIWTFIQKSQNDRTLRYFAILCLSIEMQISDYSPRKSEAELACTLSKINITKNSFPYFPPLY